MKGGNLYSVMKAISLLRTKLFQTYSKLIHKMSDSFSSVQCRLKGFWTSYTLDRNSKEGRLSLYCHEFIPPRFLNSGSTCNFETISLEINLKKRKWLLTYCYNPHRCLISSHSIS